MKITLISLILVFAHVTAMGFPSGGESCDGISALEYTDLADRVAALEKENKELKEKINEMGLLRVGCRCFLTPDMPAFGKGVDFAQAMRDANRSCQSQSRINYFFDQNYVSACEFVGHPQLDAKGDSLLGDGDHYFPSFIITDDVSEQ